MHGTFGRLALLLTQRTLTQPHLGYRHRGLLNQQFSIDGSLYPHCAPLASCHDRKREVKL